jgi:protein tyrosine phosphatase (PTP) superfamily phosphohydrolase (DUF442 family)
MYLTGQIKADDIVPYGQSLGWNFLSSSSAVPLINEVAGLNLQYSATPLLELPLTDSEASYKSYYWTHRVVTDTWYNVGQVLDSHVQTIAYNGYKTVVSLRSNGEATTRLSIDPTTGAVPNGEFSDANGLYSVALEETAFVGAGLKYYNLPVESASAWTNFDNFYQVFVPTMKLVEQDGPVLLHCASGYRSSGYLTTYLALERGECTSWALNQASLVGFSFDQSTADAAVVSFMQTILKC